MTDMLIYSHKVITRVFLSTLFNFVLILNPLSNLYAQIEIVKWDFDNSNTNPSVDRNGGATASVGNGFAAKDVSFTSGNPGKGWQVKNWLPAQSINHYYQFIVNFTDYQPTSLTFDERQQKNGAPQQYAVEYSLDGSSFELLSSNSPTSPNWSTQQENLQSIPKLINANQVYFRLYGYGGSKAWLNWMIDNVTFKGIKADQPPQATYLDASNISPSHGSEYLFKITYEDDSKVDINSLDNNDIQIILPSTDTVMAEFIQVDNTSDGTPRVATYKLIPSSSTWEIGAYLINIMENEVADKKDPPDPIYYVEGGQLGEFRVEPIPQAILKSVPNITSSTNTEYQFEVEYIDNNKIDTGTLDNNDIEITGSNGFNDMAGYEEVIPPDNATLMTAHYKFTPPTPPDGWDVSDEGIYNITIKAAEVQNELGLSVAEGVLGRFYVDLGDTPPTATLSPMPDNITTAGGTDYTFTVQYADNAAINTNEFDDSDIIIISSLGTNILATKISIDDDTPGTPRIVTYQISAPGSTWDNLDNGTYTIQLQANQVSDMVDNFAPAQELGQFEVNVPAARTLNITKSGDGSGTVTGSGIQCGATCSHIYPEGSTVQLTVTPASNSLFGGWSGSAECGFYFTITADMNCIAKFSEQSSGPPSSLPLPDTMTLTLSWEGNGQGEFQFDPPPQQMDCDNDKAQCRYVFATATWVKIIAMPDENSEFVKWNGVSEECYQEHGNQLELFMSANYNCIANLIGRPRVLNLFQVGNGIGQVMTSPVGEVLPCEAGQCFQFAAGSEVTLTSSTAIGSRLEKWDGDEDCQDGHVIMDTDKICVATFSTTPTVNLTLDYESSQGQVTFTPTGENCGPHCQRYNSDTLVTLIAQPHDGFRVVSWGGDCGKQTQATLEITLNQDTHCYVTFTSVPSTPPDGEPSQPHSYTLTVTTTGIGTGTVTSIPTGLNCGTDCTESYPAGTSVTLTAVPADGATFAAWEGDCPHGQVHIDANKNCIANFSAIPTYRLTVAKAGRGNGTITSNPGGIQCGEVCQKDYPVMLAPDAVEGATVTLTPTAAAGSQFSHWQEAGCNSTLHMLAHKTCTAIFESVGTLQWVSPTQVEVNEEDEQITLYVSRSGGSYGAASVDYTVTAGTATAGSDYSATDGTLTWSAGDSADKTVVLKVLPDKLSEETETVTLTLTNPNGGVLLGTPTTVTLTIADVPWVSSVQFAMPEYRFNEGEPEATLLVTRAGSRRWPLSVDFATVDGSAVANLDYTPIKGTLTWTDGDRTKRVIHVPILVDKLTAGNKNFLVRLANLTGEAQFGPHSQTVVTIINTPTAGSLELSDSEYTVNESTGAITIQVNRIGDSSGAISVNYATGDESAKADQDYTLTQGSLNWSDADTQPKSFTIPIVVDDQTEGEETVKLVLTNPTGGASLGAIHTATLTIIDTDPDNNTSPPPSSKPVVTTAGVIQFTAPRHEIMEQALLYPVDGQISILVTRTGGSQGAVTVNYTTQDGTALASKHYQPTQGQLSWVDGEIGEKEIRVDSWDNKLREGTKNFLILLSQPTGGAVLGEYAKTIVAIQDDDSSVIQFAPHNRYSVMESEGQAKITVSRTNSSMGPVSVHYATQDGTAQAGKDYISTSGILTWEPNENHDQTIIIPLLSDSFPEGDETLQISLSKPTGEVVLAEPNEKTITITETQSSDCAINSVINCLLVLEDKSDPLQNIRVTSRGIVIGGQLGGKVHNAGWIQNAFLLPNTIISGGQIGGFLKGDPQQPTTALLRYVQIAAGTTLEWVVIGEGSQVDSQVVFGEGVRFENNNLIPHDLNLAELLGYAPQTVFGQVAVNLTDDVLYPSSVGGIVGMINSLPQLENQGWVLKQDSDYGSLYLEIGNFRYAVLPLQVKHILTKMVQERSLGMTWQTNGQVSFITHTGRELIAQPVIQDPVALNTQLRQLGLNEVEMLDNGNLKMPLSDGSYFIARASLAAQRVSPETPLGLNYIHQPVYLIFADSQGQRWQQFIYATAAHPQMLYELEETLLINEEQLRIRKAGRIYQGWLDYLVTPEQQKSNSNNLQLFDIPDINGDHCDDIRITYPSQESQVMYIACGTP